MDGNNPPQASVNQPITNINIANIANLPQNILQNLAGLNLANLQNMSVSLSMPGGGIAVPVPISLINTNAGVLQNHGGIFVTSNPGNLPTASTVSSASSSNTQVYVHVVGYTFICTEIVRVKYYISFIISPLNMIYY